MASVLDSLLHGFGSARFPALRRRRRRLVRPRHLLPGSLLPRVPAPHAGAGLPLPTLFGVQANCDNRSAICSPGPRSLRHLFPLCLGAVREQGALAPFGASAAACSSPSTASRSTAQTPSAARSAQPAMSGPTSPSSTSIRCSRRRSSPTATTASCRMPEFVQPQTADQPELSGNNASACERNAAKRWLPAHSDSYAPTGRSFSATTYCCQPLWSSTSGRTSFCCKPSSHKSFTLTSADPNRSGFRDAPRQPTESVRERLPFFTAWRSRPTTWRSRRADG